MKYIKLFEGVSDDILEIKENFQCVADDWNLAYKSIDEITPMIRDALNYTNLSGGGYYTVTETRDPKNKYSVLVYLPHVQLGMFYIQLSLDIKKFDADVSEFNSIIKKLGYNPAVIHDNDSVLYIITINI